MNDEEDGDRVREFPELANVSPEEALAMIESPARFSAWLDRMRFPRFPRGIHMALAQLAESAEAARERAVLDARYTAANRQRTDLDALKAYVEGTKGGLPPRLRQVALLCIDHGMTIEVAAERLGISRETVRVHLRRLRALTRLHARAPADLPAHE